jgi:4-amino-4-deoxy-L-arabinose transferase-like glycosyltransferase
MSKLTHFTSNLRNSHFNSLLYWAAMFFIWFFALSLRDLISTDEGRYADIAMEMLQSGDWITPRLNGLLYFEKPPLQYWASAISFAFLGLHDFTARLWPGLTGFLTVIAIWFTAKRLWSNEAGEYAALVVVSCAWMFTNSHFLTLDMGVSFFLALSLCCFLLAQDAKESHHQAWWMRACWAAMACATLSKGLIGLLIPGTSLFFYSLINRDIKPWLRMQWISGLSIFLLIAAPWFYLVSVRNPEFAHFFFIHEHVERFLTTTHQHEGPIWFFIPDLLIGLLPWTSLLFVMLIAGWKKTESDGDATSSFNPKRFLIVWCGFIFLFFSVSGSKLPSYILPIFPALGLLVGPLLARYTAQALKKHVVVPVILGLLLSLIYPLRHLFHVGDLSPQVVQQLALCLSLAGLIFLLGSGFAWRALNHSQTLLAVRGLAMASIIAFSVATYGYDGFGQIKGSKAIVEKIAADIKPETQVFSVGVYDHTFPYYLRRTIWLVDVAGEFEFGKNAEPERWISSKNGFIDRWNAAPSAVAMMDAGSYNEMIEKKLPMKIRFQDSRRIVVVKP